MAFQGPPQSPTSLHRRTNIKHCTHSSMVRVYDKGLLCSNCFKPGSMGWLYRCVEDRESMIEHDRIKLNSRSGHVFDQIGNRFFQNLNVRDRGVIARSDKLSFLNEVTQDQLASYTPAQIITILKQRERVIERAQEDATRTKMYLLSTVTGLSVNLNQASQLFNTGSSVRTYIEECRYVICPRCRPNCRDRAYVSLDGVAKGDIPPTAATAFGFHGVGCRPIIHPDIIRNIGTRVQSNAVGPPATNPQEQPPGHDTSPASESVSDTDGSTDTSASEQESAPTVDASRHIPHPSQRTQPRSPPPEALLAGQNFARLGNETLSGIFPGVAMAIQKTRWKMDRNRRKQADTEANSNGEASSQSSTASGSASGRAVPSSSSVDIRQLINRLQKERRERAERARAQMPAQDSQSTRDGSSTPIAPTNSEDQQAAENPAKELQTTQAAPQDDAQQETIATTSHKVEDDKDEKDEASDMITQM